MTNGLKFSQYNEHSILIEWPAIIDDLMLDSILNVKNNIQSNCIKEKVEIITTYNSILVIYKSTIDNINDEISMLKGLSLEQKVQKENKLSIWEIPVCYDDEFGMDLEEFSNRKGLSKSKIIQLHSEIIYTVFFIGFLPGFLYLGGLKPKLFIDRKTTPNLNVKKGSVAIGGQQTGIYPQDSPGGWYIIGNSPIELFNAYNNPPCFIKAGDKIKFKSIDKSHYLDIEDRVAKSSFQLKPINTNA